MFTPNITNIPENSRSSSRRGDNERPCFTGQLITLAGDGSLKSNVNKHGDAVILLVP